MATFGAVRSLALLGESTRAESLLTRSPTRRLANLKLIARVGQYNPGPYSPVILCVITYHTAETVVPVVHNFQDRATFYFEGSIRRLYLVGTKPVRPIFST